MIVRLSSGDQQDGFRLVCFPYGGGSAAFYRSWIADLPPRVGLYSIDLPGRGRRYREPSFLRMEDLVSATCASLRPLLDREYGLFGHSLGGRIAFGIAERLRSEGLPRPRLLAVSGCLPPDRRPRRDVSTMSEAEFLAYLYELGGTPPEAIDNAELMALLSKSLRADFMLAQQLVPVSGRLDCPLLVLGGNADHEVTYDDLQHWRNVSTGPFRLELFPGHHFFIHTMRKTVVDLLLDHIARCASATVNGRGELT